MDIFRAKNKKKMGLNCIEKFRWAKGRLFNNQQSIVSPSVFNSEIVVSHTENIQDSPYKEEN